MFPPRERRASGIGTRYEVEAPAATSDTPVVRLLAGVADEVELDPVHQRAVRDRARVSGTLAQGLAVRLPGPRDVVRRDRGERHQVHRVDLDLRGPDPVAAALLDLGPLPEPERHGDV